MIKQFPEFVFFSYIISTSLIIIIRVNRFLGCKNQSIFLFLRKELKQQKDYNLKVQSLIVKTNVFTNVNRGALKGVIFIQLAASKLKYFTN